LVYNWTGGSYRRKEIKMIDDFLKYMDPADIDNVPPQFTIDFNDEFAIDDADYKQIQIDNED